MMLEDFVFGVTLPLVWLLLNELDYWSTKMSVVVLRKAYESNPLLKDLNDRKKQREAFQKLGSIKIFAFGLLFITVYWTVLLGVHLSPNVISEQSRPMLLKALEVLKFILAICTTGLTLVVYANMLLLQVWLDEYIKDLRRRLWILQRKQKH